MSRVHERSAARRAAAQILYSGEIRDASALELLRKGDIDSMGIEVSDYTILLIEGVEKVMDDLDRRLSETSENWSVSRMPLLDLAILRIALYEMIYVEDVPISVSINEAVEIAKDFGGDDDSPKFINGILGNVARQLEESE